MIATYEKGWQKAKEGLRRKRQETSEDSDSESEPEEEFIVLVVPHTVARGNTQDLEKQRARSRPAAQIVPSSSLGIALGNVARLADDPEDPDDPDGSSEYESSWYSRSMRSRSSLRSCRWHKQHQGSKKRS